MGRIYSGKPVRDTETAAESIINNTLISSTRKNLNENAAQISVAAQQHDTRPIDDFGEKKSR